jgi:hypothetical protein
VEQYELLRAYPKTSWPGSHACPERSRRAAGLPGVGAAPGGFSDKR